MRRVYYAIAFVAMVLSGLLWLFVISQVRGAASAPAAASVAFAAPPGRIPVVPVLRVLDRDAVTEGCWRGYRARRWVDAQGAEHIEWIQTSAGRIRC